VRYQLLVFNRMLETTPLPACTCTVFSVFMHPCHSHAFGLFSMHGKAFEVKKDKECETRSQTMDGGLPFRLSSSVLFYKAKVIGTN